MSEGFDEPRRAVCCSSPASMGYWLIVSVVAWALLTLVGFYWRPLGPLSASTILIAMRIGCAANWRRNRILHCGLTATLPTLGRTLLRLTRRQPTHVPP